MKPIFSALLLLASSALAQQPTPARTVAHVTTYQPPVFTDPDRLKKLEAAFPIVEKLYKDVAEKRHIPGLTFGI
ncbi:MAG: serine hydrolase, partial [Hymenobacter sp.]